MRTVLYTEDMEPITVLELRDWHIRFLEHEGMVRLARRFRTALAEVC